MYKMNKRVFRILAYIQTTPQDQLNKDPIIITSHFDDGKVTYGLHQYRANLNDYIHIGNNYTLTDLRNFSRLSEPLTGKVALMDITSLVLTHQVNPAQKHIINKFWEEEYESSPAVCREQHQTFLHCFHHVKAEPKSSWISAEEEAGVI